MDNSAFQALLAQATDKGKKKGGPKDEMMQLVQDEDNRSKAAFKKKEKAKERQGDAQSEKAKKKKTEEEAGYRDRADERRNDANPGARPWFGVRRAACCGALFARAAKTAAALGQPRVGRVARTRAAAADPPPRRGSARSPRRRPRCVAWYCARALSSPPSPFARARVRASVRRAPPRRLQRRADADGDDGRGEVQVPRRRRRAHPSRQGPRLRSALKGGGLT